MNEENTESSLALEQLSKRTDLVAKPSGLIRRSLRSLAALKHVLTFPADNANCCPYQYDHESNIVNWFVHMAPSVQWNSFHEFNVKALGCVQGRLDMSSGKRIVLVVHGDLNPSLGVLDGLNDEHMVGILLLGCFPESEFRSLGHFRGLQCLSLPRSGVADSSLSSITNLKSLRYLDLGSSEVTDRGLEQLADFQNLTHLDLTRTKVTGEFLGFLPNLHDSLQYLNFWGCRTVTDHGLKDISRLKGLTVLDLGSTNVTDEGISHLQDLSALTTLDLSNSKFGDAHLNGLASLKKLRSLNLLNTEIGDRAMIAISSIRSLTHLNLNSTNVTEKAIEYLSKLESLVELKIECTPLAGAPLEELSRRLPNCGIFHREWDGHMSPIFVGRETLEWEFRRWRESADE